MSNPVIPTLLAVLCALPLAAQDSVRMVRESSSGVEFPGMIPGPAGQSLALMGTGIRTKTFLKVKVYAFGLYVEPDGARRHLMAFTNVPHRDLERNQAFYDAVLGLNFPMALRLVMTRDVGAEDMAEAFDEALGPRVARAAAEMSMPDGREALQQFRGYFSVGEMTDGSELLFTCTTDGTLHARIKGQGAAPIRNRALCWALFDVYLGADPISKDGKKGVIMGFPNLLLTRGG